MTEPIIIGNATLYLGHCMDFMRALPDGAFDLAIVDPPYFDGPNKSGYYGAGYSTLNVKASTHYDSLLKWEVPKADYFIELDRVSKAQIIWGANHFAGNYDFSSPGWIVWDKVNGESSFADVELAYCSMDRAARLFRYVWAGMHQGQYGGDKSKNDKRIHPTQKPVALYEWLIDKYAKTGQRILDTHLGSGSSAVAANRRGMEFVGVELDGSMFEAACSRVRDELRQPSLLPGTLPQMEQTEIPNE